MSSSAVEPTSRSAVVTPAPTMARLCGIWPSLVTSSVDPTGMASLPGLMAYSVSATGTTSAVAPATGSVVVDEPDPDAWLPVDRLASATPLANSETTRASTPTPMPRIAPRLPAPVSPVSLSMNCSRARTDGPATGWTVPACRGHVLPPRSGACAASMSIRGMGMARNRAMEEGPRVPTEPGPSPGRPVRSVVSSAVPGAPAPRPGTRPPRRGD